MGVITDKLFSCPRCGCVEFKEIDCGPDSYYDDISYTSEICLNCGLYYSGWTDKWLVDCDDWIDEEDSIEFKPFIPPITQQLKNQAIFNYCRQYVSMGCKIKSITVSDDFVIETIVKAPDYSHYFGPKICKEEIS